MRFEQDPRLTFDTFVVGPGNRMAAAAARRAAENPGTSYNPLFVYGGAGVGKTHLLHAVGTLATAVHADLRVLYLRAGELVDRFSAAVAEGKLNALCDELLEADLLLLDDADELAGRARTQQELLWLWDALLEHGVQLVVSALRLPGELPAIDDDLRARLAGGLTVDVAPAEVETRLELVRRRAAETGVELASGVDEALAELPLDGAHALHAGVDRIAALQSERGETVDPAEVPTVVGLATEGDEARPLDEFSAFLADVATTVEQLMEEAPWRRRLAEAILRWEGEGVRTRRLEAALEADTAPDVDRLLDGFGADVERLRAVHAELAKLDEKAAASPVLADPDRVGEAEAMLVSARAAEERRAQEPAAAAPAVDRWYWTNAEKVAWGWPALDDRLIEELG